MAVRVTDLKKSIRSIAKLLERPPLGADAPPLEIRAAVVDAIENLITVVGVGRTSFPYERIGVRLLVATREDKSALEPVFGELEARVRERFRERRCDVPRALGVNVSFVRKVPPGWRPGQLFSLDCTPRTDTDTASPSALPPTLKIAVVSGTANRKAYAFREPTVLVGRTREAVNGHHVRHNQVAFHNDNSTVSRGHARFKYDGARTGYRVLDDGSALGTWIVRGAALIEVPHDPRGVLIKSGDEIHLGDAVLRVTIEPS